jgi:hypothetical protein
VDCVPVTVNTKRNWTPPAPTGGAQCCQDVTNSNQASSSVCGLVESLIGVDVSSLNIPIGTGCTPVSILGGVSCNTNTVQCGETFEGESRARCMRWRGLIVSRRCARRHQLRAGDGQHEA